jgi:uncharacterized protein
MRAAVPAAAAWLALLSASPALATAPNPATDAAVAIIIDDLGNSLREGRRVLRLPGAVACAILPLTPHGARLAREAHGHDREVLLHLPMEASDGTDPGPGKIDSAMTRIEVVTALTENLRSVPHVAGVSNHMGSQLTQRQEPMHWLMQAMAEHGALFFVDSRTTPLSVAAQTASEVGVPHLIRDIFLDREREVTAVEKQFDRLLELARQRGSALALGHPYPETLAVLERRLPELAEAAVRLVSLKELLARTGANARAAVLGTQGPAPANSLTKLEAAARR